MKPVLTLLCLLALAACNTMEGLGEDMEAAGNRIDRKAEQAQTEKLQADTTENNTASGSSW